MLPEQMPGVFSTGSWVKLKSLAARPELNGLTGRIVSFNAERGRYAVQMHPSGDRILLKPASLELSMDPGIESTIAAANEKYLASAEAKPSAAASTPHGVEAFDAACEQAMKAIEAMDPSAAAAAARRAIALRPTSCAGHLLLADATNYGGDLRGAIVGYVHAMERAEEGTYNWAKAAASAHEILMDPGCPSVFGASVPKPAWLDDPQLFRRVSAKVVETTASIDHPGAQAMAWRMHGDACSKLGDHREAAACYRRAAADMDSRAAAQTLAMAEAANAAAARQVAGQ
jgi:tetratricopeptide (TPR) repeat protein